MIKNIKILLGLLLIPIFSSYANTTTGKVHKLYVNQSGLVLFSLSEPVKSAPVGCANADWQYAFKTNEIGGGHMYSMLLSAQVTKTPVSVYYVTCHPEHGIAAKVEVVYQVSQ